MKTSLSALPFFVLTAAVAPTSFAAAGCALMPLVPHDNSVTAGTATINLGAADRPSAPAAWQGPLTAGTCTFDIGIIEQPMALTLGAKRIALDEECLPARSKKRDKHAR